MNQRSFFTSIPTILVLICAVVVTRPTKICADIATDTVTVTIPDVWALPGDTILIPLTISPISISDSVYAFEGKFSYADSVLKGITVLKEQTLTEESELNPTSNVMDNSLLFAFGGIFPLHGSGALATLVFEVIDTAKIGQSSSIRVDRFMINEGRPYTLIQDATFTIGEGSELMLFYDSHNFGAVEVGKSKQWQFSISNQGTADLLVVDIYSDSTQFAFEPTTFPITLRSDQSEDITVTFWPSTEDTISGRLRITSNDPQHPIEIVTLSGSGTTFTAIDDPIELNRLPEKYRLFQNYPNPFNPNTDIRFQIADRRYPVHTTLKIYNILGREVRTLVNTLQEPGHYTYIWDARDATGREVSTGVYLYRFQAGEFSETKRMVYVR